MRSLTGSTDVTYVQVHHAMLPHLQRFTPAGWIVFTALALHMDNNGYCFPSIASLVGTTGLSEGSVRRALTHLMELSIDGHIVLAKKPRFTHEGRQTSNGFWLFPGSQFQQGEGTKSETGVGTKYETPINNNQNEQKPTNNNMNALPRKRKGPTLPKVDDPGRLLFEAYREVIFPELSPDDFNLSEWTGARHIVYQMHHKGITSGDVAQACRTLLLKWSNRRDLITLNALWKHWASATTGVPVTPTQGKTSPTAYEVGMSAIDAFRKVTGGNQ
jgi:hypothetical protein